MAAVQVNFTDTSTVNTGDIVTAEWNFGDASPVVTRNYPADSTTVAHTYADNGTYTVTLTVYGDIGSSSDSSQQIINI